jgi:hypothetical protein
MHNNEQVAAGGNVIPFPGAGRNPQAEPGNAPRLGDQIAVMVASFHQLRMQAADLRHHTVEMDREATNAAGAIRNVVEVLQSFDPAALLRSLGLEAQPPKQARG